ncbi:hypothetical protein L6452_28078 [Arctium lappa]|uniref:Uncharacterized protein n=1 Tax=Arctium lappa TaxID=4217 RepID=A0ACB8ZXQ8_ARCLA|nr:hypothetical protein L6452_28078 [Arctium lappa]
MEMKSDRETFFSMTKKKTEEGNVRRGEEESQGVDDTIMAPCSKVQIDNSKVGNRNNNGSDPTKDNGPQSILSMKVKEVNKQTDNKRTNGRKRMSYKEKLKERKQEGIAEAGGRMESQTRVSSQSNGGGKSKCKRKDNCILGRGRISFHYIKQKAQNSQNGKGKQKKSEISEDPQQAECAKLIGGGGAKSKSKSISISAELRNVEAMEDVEDFGNEIGVIWGNDNESRSKKGKSRLEL